MRLVGGIHGEAKPDPFERLTETQFNGRNVEHDTELTISGARGGRCRFRAVVTNPRNGVQWVDVVDARGALRSFPLDAVTRVHRIDKTRKGAA